MKISNITKHKLKEIVGILLYFLFLGSIAVFLLSNRNDFPFLRGLIVLASFGFLASIYEIVISPKLKRFPFLVLFLTTFFYYSISFSILVSVIEYASLVYKKNMSWEQAFQVSFFDFFPTGIGLPMFLLFLGVALIVVIRFADTMVGYGMILQYLTGKYHKPRSEKRIFMFLDLKSSTSIAEKLGHDMYSAFLKDFFNKIDEAILSTEGFLFQYVGDEIVMVWNYKKGFRKNNILKFYKMIKDILENSKKEFFDTYGIIPEYKAGIHCGTVSITEIGSLRKSIAFHGDPINTAARICSKCKELNEDLIISDKVYNLLENDNYYSYEFIGDHELRGKEDPIKLHKVILS